MIRTVLAIIMVAHLNVMCRALCRVLGDGHHAQRPLSLRTLREALLSGVE